jgi:hypothetical protein
MRSVAARRCMKQNSLPECNYVGVLRWNSLENAMLSNDPASGGICNHIHTTSLRPCVPQCL